MPEPTTGSVYSANASSQVLTFLIADVRGYTRFTQEHGDEAAARLAESFAAIAGDVVTAGGGEVVELRGDEALATFASARQALRTAVELQARFVQTAAVDPSLPLTVGIGLDAGDAVPVAGGYRGGALNLAARLCSLAGAGEVFASETVIALTGKTEGLVYVDRGEVPLQGLSEPVRVMQIAREGSLPASLPPLQEVAAAHPTNLPDEPTPFIGREREMAAIAELLQQPELRLLTLTGPGGTGKTRLALQVGGRLLPVFEHGVFFVSLASVSDPALVPAALAAVLGIKEEREQLLIDTLKEQLRDKHLLLIIDNVEHLLDVSSLVSELLDACPRLHMLVTSRIVLRLAREHIFDVPPLSVPDPAHTLGVDALLQYEAVELFVARAQAATSSFSLTGENARAVAEICSRLDGLPLAIELAAARIRIFPPAALLDRLSNRLTLLTGGARDLPARQQTLRGAIDWSYSLLNDGERRLFARLSVFAGGCTLAAAEEVCNPESDLEIELVDGVTSLVEQSLLRQEGEEEPRFTMLETIREYASRQLEASGEAERVRRRYAKYFLRLAEGARPVRGRRPPREWLDHLEAEHDNARAALRWARETGEIELGLKLAVALGRFWLGRRHFAEGRRELGSLLATPESQRMPALRAAALQTAGELAFAQGDVEQAVGLLEQSLALFRDLDDARNTARVIRVLADASSWRGDQQRGWELAQEQLARARESGRKEEMARALLQVGSFLQLGVPAAHANQTAAETFEESLALFREAGDQPGTVEALIALGRAALREGDLARARDLLDQSLALLRRSRMHRGFGQLLPGVADLARRQGDYELATTLVQEHLDGSLSHGDSQEASHTRCLLAWYAREHGQYERSAALYEESLALFREVEDLGGIGKALLGLGDVARDQGDAERTRAASQESLELFRRLGDVASVGWSLHNLGLVAWLGGDDRRAVSLLEESLRLMRTSRVSPGEVLASIGLVTLDQGDDQRAGEVFAESLMEYTGERSCKVAAALEGLAAVEAVRGAVDRAARLFGAAGALRDSLDTPVPPVNRPVYDRTLTVTRTALGEERFAEVCAEGRAMTVEQASAYALERVATSVPGGVV